jgi:hypothetical protein
MDYAQMYSTGCYRDIYFPVSCVLLLLCCCCCCRALAVWLQKVDPKTDGAARDWVAIYDECRCAHALQCSDSALMEAAGQHLLRCTAL